VNIKKGKEVLNIETFAIILSFDENIDDAFHNLPITCLSTI